MKEENILAGLGVPAGKADSYLITLIRTLESRCIEIARPSAVYKTFINPDFDLQLWQMHLDDSVFHLGNIVWSALKKSTHIALFIATCGFEVERLSKQLMHDGQSLEGLIVDLIGSEIAEYTAGLVHCLIEDDASAIGLKITNRYSPGYCNWPVSDQQQLFNLMKPDTCDVSLTPSSLMIPIKSVSGVAGIGTHVKFSGYACAKCDAGQCIYRDKKLV